MPTPQETKTVSYFNKKFNSNKRIRDLYLLEEAFKFLALTCGITNSPRNQGQFRLILCAMDFPDSCMLDEIKTIIPQYITAIFGSIATERELYQLVGARSVSTIKSACISIKKFCDNPIIDQFIQRLKYMEKHGMEYVKMRGQFIEYRSSSYERDYDNKNTNPCPLHEDQSSTFLDNPSIGLDGYSAYLNPSSFLTFFKQPSLKTQDLVSQRDQAQQFAPTDQDDGACPLNS